MKDKQDIANHIVTARNNLEEAYEKAKSKNGYFYWDSCAFLKDCLEELEHMFQYIEKDKFSEEKEQEMINKINGEKNVHK